MTPGTYLRTRRLAAQLTTANVANPLVALAFGIDTISRRPISSVALKAELEAVESDRRFYAAPELTLLRRIVPHDPEVYERLLDRYHADPATRAQLPLPQLCRNCACSFFDPCLISGQPFAAECACHWAEPDLCSACTDAPPPPVDDPPNKPLKLGVVR